MYLNIQVIAIVLRLFFNMALKLSLTGSSFTYLLITVFGIILSLGYFEGLDPDFSFIQAVESIIGGFFAGIFWLRTRELNSRLFFKLKLFYLNFFNTIWAILFLIVFY